MAPFESWRDFADDPEVEAEDAGPARPPTAEEQVAALIVMFLFSAIVAVTIAICAFHPWAHA